MTELSKGELSAKLSELERLAYLERALGLARGIAIEIDEELIIARPDERAVTSGLHPGSVTVVLQGEGHHEYQAVYVRQPGCKLILEFVEEE